VLNWHVPVQKNVEIAVVHSAGGYYYDDPKTGKTTPMFPYPAFELLRKSDNVFSVLFAYHPAKKLNVMTQGQAEVVSGEYISGDYFRGLGLAPAAGRLIISDDDRVGAPAVAVLSYGFAQARFGDAARAAGQPVMINDVPFTAIGVAPPGFFGVDPAKAPAVYLPMHTDSLVDFERDPSPTPGGRYFNEHYYWIEMMGRLRPGVTMAQAQAAVGPVFEQWVAATAALQNGYGSVIRITKA
jgi:hypothetical protein